MWTDDALQLLSRHRWPGNVRELANIVERLAILHAGQVVMAEQVREVLPIDREVAPTRAPLPDPAALDRPLTETLDEFERAVIVRALSSAGGNVAEAARRLKTDRPNLYRRMKRLGVTEGGAQGSSGHGGVAGGAGNRNA
jgi:two-component system nitrogen regulation response regulator NtrX